MENINPDKINVAKHRLVKAFIKDLIERKELDFEKMLGFFHKCVEKKDHEEALLWCYYINNVMKKRPGIDDLYRNELVVSMLQDIKKNSTVNFDTFIEKVL